MRNTYGGEKYIGKKAVMWPNCETKRVDTHKRIRIGARRRYQGGRDHGLNISEKHPHYG